MKEPRNVLKSIRISETVFNEIESYDGDNWNDKLNNFLEFYINTAESYKEYIQQLENEILQKQQLLEEFKKRISKFENLLK